MSQLCCRGLLGLVLLAALSCVGAEPEPADHVVRSPNQQARIALSGAPLEPPGGADRLCSGHVSGSPLPDGTPGSHITWNAYTSGELPGDLSALYRQLLGRIADSSREGCTTWRHPPDEPRQILEICPVAATGPWSECASVPEQASSVVLISSIERPD